ncbi:DUF2550 domain-containing protein [Nocardioides bruguierae]|uniref:DUF2550 domain-containing protein n=1 Tax=Nocardioides bruguierae TaxID=2945102 RepID=A0A9X2IEB3_9ACTN|nr:DUF2550 domain-containing protein [Nocardioides bruguierae]MCM0619179.1 DUF2550 domain-containing protein [Nocardioides bruguierae]
MAIWEWLLDAALVLLALLLLYVVGLVLRRRLLGRHGGTFELAHRVDASRPGRGWALGVGRYADERLEWFRVFSLSPLPKSAWARAELEYHGRRHPDGDEQMALYPGHVVITCTGPRGAVELAMAPETVTGFQAWLEARPPGAEMPGGARS